MDSYYSHCLAEILRAEGIDADLDIDTISAGERIVDAVQNRIRAVDALILVGSRDALQSPWILSEAEFALKIDVPVFPVLRDAVDAAAIPLSLRTIHWAFDSSPNQPIDKIASRLVFAIQTRINYARRHDRDPSSRPTEKRALNEGKLIVVGRGEVGKTSLVKRLIKDKFDGDESKTQGINITNWSLRIADDAVRMNVWDFGGQEIMHATHQFFLTEQTLYLLVLNGREGGEDLDAEYWLKLIESFGGKSPVVIVQNKVAQHPFELNYRGLQTRFPQITAFVKTDCKTNAGITNLRTAIEHSIAGMEEVRTRFPVDWFKVKERLESMKDDFVTYEAFRQLCEDEGIDTDSDRDALTWVLHCLGIALNYRDDSRLRETSVLKPKWVTEGIYQVLNAPQLADRRGELHLSDLVALLPKKRYPREKHFFLLELMRKFSLCFEFPDDRDRYLIPELLGKEEPVDVASFRPNECLNFEYQYGVLPEGFIPRFIVRTHTLNHSGKRWHTGVILAHEDAVALVMALPADRRVIVRVKSGSAGSRRRLLAIVRYDLDKINAEFKDRLDAQARVPLPDFPSFSVEYKKLIAFEKQGVTSFPEFVGDHVAIVNVDELLNGVDLGTQQRDFAASLNTAKSIFISYSHKDEPLKERLETHLKLLQRLAYVSVWTDRKIISGNDWDHEIDRNLERAAIILLLVSADFIASDYVWDKEMKRALDRHESGDARVIPIIVRSCDWKIAPFAKLEALPKDGAPVTPRQDEDAAWTNIAQGIRTVVDELNS